MSLSTVSNLTFDTKLRMLPGDVECSQNRPIPEYTDNFDN